MIQLKWAKRARLVRTPGKPREGTALNSLRTATIAALGVAALLAAAPAALALPHNHDVPHSHGPDGKHLDKRARVPGATYDVDAHASWSTTEYDGQAFVTDQPDMTSHPTVHAVYVYPSDQSSRFSQFAAMFQADARQASSFLAPYGVRFDERPSNLGGTNLDITVIKSAYKARQLGGGQQFSLVKKELESRGFFSNPNKKQLVWLDAASSYCGQGELYQDTERSPANNNERSSLAIVYRPYTTRKNPYGDPKTGGFCRGRTAMHEVGHNLGALQQVAPNAFDGAHCDDSAEDVMCYTSETSNDTGLPAFDYGNDDYWDPAGGKLGWWTANLSKFVCPTDGCSSPNTPDY